MIGCVIHHVPAAQYSVLNSVACSPVILKLLLECNACSGLPAVATVRGFPSASSSQYAFDCMDVYASVAHTLCQMPTSHSMMLPLSNFLPICFVAQCRELFVCMLQVSRCRLARLRGFLPSACRPPTRCGREGRTDRAGLCSQQSSQATSSSNPAGGRFPTGWLTFSAAHGR